MQPDSFYFVCPRADMREDSWTYGDWRQYLCTHEDGSVQCAKISDLPFMLGILGLIPLFLGLLGVYIGFYDFDAVKWPWVLGFLAVGLLVEWLVLAFHMARLHLMVPVGPKQYDGKRVFWHELEEEAA